MHLFHLAFSREGRRSKRNTHTFALISADQAKVTYDFNNSISYSLHGVSQRENSRFVWWGFLCQVSYLIFKNEFWHHELVLLKTLTQMIEWNIIL